MYLNLDLLYNVNNYFFTLFYYENDCKYTYTVYSPKTLKLLFVNSLNKILYLNSLIQYPQKTDFKITKNIPFELDKDAIDFLNIFEIRKPLN